VHVDAPESAPAILCVGYTPASLDERCKLLRAHGYDAQLASTHDQALEKLRRRPFPALVIGHAVPEHERMEFIAAARALNPDAIVVLLYWDSIRRAEAADAILCIGNGPMALVQALRDLLAKQ
jgi:DNA-binding NtrC family response regulator